MALRRPTQSRFSMPGPIRCTRRQERRTGGRHPHLAGVPLCAKTIAPSASLRLARRRSGHSPTGRSHSSELRRPGGDRDGERAADHRAAEALEQQTATAEVLQVINASPGNLAPVFDAMLEKAYSLCDTAFGCLGLYDGERFRAVALRGVLAAFADMLERDTRLPTTWHAQRRCSRRAFLHIDDMLATRRYRSAQRAVRALAELGGARTLLLVPLRKDETLLGSSPLYRQEVRPFSDKQIALLEELRGPGGDRDGECPAADRAARGVGAADCDCRSVAGHQRSPGNLAPVFDAVLEKAIRLCEAAFGIALHV